MNKEFISTAEAAKLLGISRVAVFKQIKLGKIKAQKVGRNYVIRRQDLSEVLEGTLSEEKKKAIEKAVHKTVKDYGETLRLLGLE